MKEIKIISKFLIISLLAILISVSGCKKDELTATISVNAVGSDLGGDVTGDGGSTSGTYTWNNNSTTANWNMDLTASPGGSFQLIIKDSGGVTVLSNTLTVGVGDDTASGVTTAGTAGAWTVTVILKSFNGDGSFSISPGN